MNTINDNGLLRRAGAPIHTTDAPAALYGDGLFETIRFAAGGMPLWERHWARLSAGCAALLIRVPAAWTADFMEREIRRTVAAARQMPAYRVRLHMYVAANGATRYSVTCGPMPAPHPEGVVLGVSTRARKDPGLQSHLKTCSALAYRVAAREAEAQGWDDAVLLNTAGIVVDTTRCNIFLSQGGKVFTNAVTDGAIAGVMQAQLMAWMREWDVQVEECSLTLDALYGAEEIFLTNALRGVVTVGRLVSNSHFGETSPKNTLGMWLAGMVEQKFMGWGR